MFKNFIIMIMIVFMLPINVFGTEIGQVLFQTTFDGLSNDNQIVYDGSKWQTVSDGDNNHSIQNLNTSNMSSYLRIGASDWNNYSIKFRVRAISVKAGGAMHVNFLESTDQNNCQRLILYSYYKEARIKTITNGKDDDATLISSAMNGFLNDFTEFEIRVTGVRIELYISGVKVGEATSNIYSSGTISFAFWDMVGQIDDIVISHIGNIVPVTGVTTQTAMQLHAGDVETVNYTVFPSDATIKTVKILSSNTDILTITNDGRVRAIREGTARITVRTEDGQKQAVCNVTVLPQIEPPKPYSDIVYKNGNYDISFNLKKGANICLYELNEPIEFYVKINQVAKNAVIQAVLTDVLTNTTERKTMSAETGTHEYHFIPSRYSVYALQFIVSENGNEIFSNQFDVGVSIKADSAADKSLYFGIQPHVNFAFTRTGGWDFNFNGMGKYETLDLSLYLANWLGVNLIRTDMTILTTKAEADLAPSKWQWEYMDLLVDKCDRTNIDLDIVNNNKGTEIAERYLESGLGWDVVPKSINSAVTVQSIISERYRQHANIFYEIMNEANYNSYFRGTAEEYTAVLNALTQNIKSFNSKIKVSSSGLVAKGSDNDDNAFYQGIAQNNQLDYFSYHSHGNFATLRSNYAVVKQLLNNNGINRELLLNETGMDTDDKNDQATQMMKKLLWAYGNHHKGTVFFKLRQYSEVAMPGGMGGYALVSHTGGIRQSFVTYSNLIHKLSGTQSIEVIKNDGIYSYIFHKGTKSTAVVFSDDKTTNSKIAIESNDFQAYDMYGNILPKSSEYPISENPLYFCLNDSVTKNNFAIYNENLIEGHLVIALYDKYNQLIDVSTLKNTEQDLVTTWINISPTQQVSFAKIFYWDGFNSLKPVQQTVIVR